jgi:hypothetical protein
MKLRKLPSTFGRGRDVRAKGETRTRAAKGGRTSRVAKGLTAFLKSCRR